MHKPLDRLFDRVTLTSDLILIGGRDIVMDYAKFSGFSFSRFAFVVRTNTQTHRITQITVKNLGIK